MDFIQSLDKGLLSLINTVWTHPWLDVIFPAITDLHKVLWFQILVVVLILGLFIQKFKKKAYIVFLCLILALSFSDLIGNHVFKKVFERSRPGDVPNNSVIVRSPYGGYSFVSNHATNMFCLAKFTGDLIPQLRLPLYTAAFITGYSRIYNGVHYPTDVLSGGLLGYIVGFIFSLLCKLTLQRIRKRSKL